MTGNGVTGSDKAAVLVAEDDTRGESSAVNYVP